jgi:hypothetical protein
MSQCIHVENDLIFREVVPYLFAYLVFYADSVCETFNAKIFYCWDLVGR